MTPVFIFSEQVRKILESGKKEINLPKGARISAAAYDLIRDNKLRISYGTSEKVVVDAETPTTEDKPSDAVGKKPRTVQDKPASEKIKSDLSSGKIGEISENDLEDIVGRVIERFKQLKGLNPPTSTAEESAGVDKSADEQADADDLVICRCEEITRAEIKEAIRNGMQTLNGIKRITRAGMGLCQGETCQRLVAQILSQELGLSPADVEPTTARGPVRPLRLEVFANS